MSRGINKWIGIGNLGNDPKASATQSGTQISNFSVAINESWQDKQTGQKQQRTEWVNCVAFNKLAEICNQYLKKGSQVYLEGKIQTRKYQGQDGQDRYTTEINVNEMQMLGGRGDAGDGVATAQNRGGYGNASAPQPAPAPSPAGDDFDDIPF